MTIGFLTQEVNKMSDIALYNTLRKISDVTDAEAKEVVADVASSKEVATKADLKTVIAESKTEILKQQIVFALFIIIAVGLMVKFL